MHLPYAAARFRLFVLFRSSFPSRFLEADQPTNKQTNKRTYFVRTVRNLRRDDDEDDCTPAEVFFNAVFFFRMPASAPAAKPTPPPLPPFSTDLDLDRRRPVCLSDSVCLSAASALRCAARSFVPRSLSSAAGQTNERERIEESMPPPLPSSPSDSRLREEPRVRVVGRRASRRRRRRGDYVQ